MKSDGNRAGAQSSAARPDWAAWSGRGKMPNIVVIDGDDLMRTLLREWLVDAGYSVRDGTPSTLPRADRPDLVILDMYMPRHAGAEFVRHVQRIYPDTPIIAISTQFRPGLDVSARAAQALGVRRLVPKPCLRGDLLDAVRAAIGPPP